MMNRPLKAKIKALAAEAAIIRIEERKALGNARWWKGGDHYRQGNLVRGYATTETRDAYGVYESLRHHRVYNVREEARASLIAYGFLRGKPFYIVEGFKDEATLNEKRYMWARAINIAWRFSDKKRSEEDFRLAFIAWLNESCPDGELLKVFDSYLNLKKRSWQS